MSTLETLGLSVQDGDEVQAVELARKAIIEGLPINTIVDTLTADLREVGNRFARQEIFLPEMMLAARAMQSAMAELQPELAKSATPAQKKGVVVIGTVEGDMHEIGKDIAITMLKSAGFEIHDLGANVNALEFVRRAEAIHADIIGISALMTTTMPAQKEVIEILKAKGLRSKYHVILGGAPVTREWVEGIGADSWGENAGVAVEILERVMAERSK
jgi:corrinoid protein of di/trimethylamine methyltransferase